MSEDGLSEPCDEHSMELFVESLTGTSFEMRVYSTDTVLDIKNKIFRVEGIPVPQQNLLFQMKELSDHSRLADVGIVNGCTLRLVTAMRGGPISTRRWTSDHMVWKDLKDLIEHTREELGDKLGTKVSVLVFKEGDVIKWLRVIENEDGSYSPYNEQRAIAPPCSSSGNDVGGCIGGRGGGGGSIGSRSGNKNYQHHKSPATDIATISSNTIDFQDLMQFKQHATALSYYHQQHQHHHYSHTHAIGPSTVVSGISDQLHQQHQYQRQQVYRRLEDDVRMKGRVKLLKARMQRAKRTKGKALSTPLASDDGSPLKGGAVVAEDIALGRRNNNLVLAAVLNDNNVDGINDTFKGDLPVESILRALQSGETLVPINDQYTLASKYHRRTHNHNSHLLQLDTSQLPHDNLTLFKPIPTGHGSSKHGDGSSATYLVGSGNSTATRTTGSGGNANDNDPNLLLMGCSANTATAMAVIRSKTRNTNSSSNIDSSINNGGSSSTNDLEVALKEKHRSSRLRLLKAAPDTNVDADAMGKRTKTTTIGRRLSNSIDSISSSNSINITTATTTTASPPPQSVLLNNAASNSNYSCTNLHVFEPQRDVITPGIRHDMTPKRRGSKTAGSAVESTATSSVSTVRDCTRERLSLPETKCRAKIGRLLNITATPGSGETSDSDDGLWSQTAGSSAANKLRHRSTALPLVLPDTTTIDKGKCANDINPSLLDDEQHIILPDIWKHHGIASITAPPSPNSIIEGTSFLCARATTTANSNSADTLASPTVVAMDSGDVEDCGIAAACLRDYIDMDSEFDKMISELRSAVPLPSIPSAIPPQYAPKDCQLYLGSPVVPRPAPASNQAATLSKSTTLTAATTTHRLGSMSTLPYHIHGLCSSPTAGTSTRRSPLYHRRTTSTTVTTAFTGTATVSPSTTNDDRTALAAAARSILEKVQRTTGSDIGGVAAIVADKAVRQRRRRYSTDDCEFTLERLQNDYVPDQFDYSDFDSCAADVDDMIGCYGQEAVVNARWMEAAAAASSTRSSGASPTQLPPTTRQRNSLRLRATAAHRDSPTDHHLHHHLCLAEQIQRLDLDTDDYRNEGVATSFSNAIGTRIGVMGSSRTANDNTSNTINIGEFSHSNFVSNGMVPCDNSIVGNTTKLPALVENRKQQQPAPDNMGVITAAERANGPRMRCAHCNRKLNITNIYDCRCGRIFCAQHRYSEVHDCAHDYKTEGRRLLAQQNPLVTAPKLAKF